MTLHFLIFFKLSYKVELLSEPSAAIIATREVMSVQCVSRLLAMARYLRPQALVLSTRYSLPVQSTAPSRTLSTTTTTLSQAAPTMARSDQALLHSHSLKVPSFGGSLWVTSPFNVSVKPIGTFDHPNLDKAFVKVYGPDKSMAELVEISVKQEGHKLSVTSSTVDMSIAGSISVEVEVPIVHNITVSRLKTANLIIQSEGGGVVCQGAIQGSVSIGNFEENNLN